MKESQTRKANDRKRFKDVQHIYNFLRKYKAPKRWSGMDIPSHPYHPESLVPVREIDA